MKNIIIKELANNGIKAEYAKVNKNGIEKDAIRIITGGNINPQFYFDEDTDVEEFIEMIVNHMENDKMPEFNFEEIFTTEYFKENAIVCVRPVRNVKGNIVKETRFEGIEMYIRIRVGEGGTITLTEDALNKYGITEDEAFGYALRNTINDVTIKGMTEVIVAMMGITVEKFEEDFGPAAVGDEQIIVSNSTGFNGASAILCNDVIERVKERLGCDKLILMPSSIHEVIFVNADKMSLEDATAMVRDVNRTQVAPEDFLSDNAYLV